MPKLALLTCALLVAYSSAFSQTDSPASPIKVQRFEYLYQVDMSEAFMLNQSRPLLRSDSSERRIQQAFVRAIGRRWNLASPDVDLKMRAHYYDTPLPDPVGKARRKAVSEPSLFLQVLHESLFNRVDDPNVPVDRVALRYIIKGGANDPESGIIEKSFNIYRKPPPAGQLVITRLSGMPNHFFNAIDTIAQQAFDLNTGASASNLFIEPACYFTGEKPSIPTRQTDIEYLNGRMDHKAEPTFTLQATAIKSEKIKKKKNVGGNAAGGLLTLVTGMSTEKSKSAIYQGESVYTQGADEFRIQFTYAEKETTERSRTKNEDGSVSTETSDNWTVSRQVDSTDEHLVLLNGDTVARFTISIIARPQKYSQMWDGKDSASISDLPKGFTKSTSEYDARISGTVMNKTFTMYTANGMLFRIFSIDGKETVAFYGGDIPRLVHWYSDLSKEELRLVTVLACVPLHYLTSTTKY
jgi:hypothetical protein